MDKLKERENFYLLLWQSYNNYIGYNIAKSNQEKFRWAKRNNLHRGVSTRKAIRQINRETLEVMQVWESIAEGASSCQVSVSNIVQVLKGNICATGGYYWEYEHDRSYDYKIQETRTNIKWAQSTGYNNIRCVALQNTTVYSVTFNVNKKSYYVGRFASLREAINSYNRKRIEMGHPEKCYIPLND